jgi:hypothetical protein
VSKPITPPSARLAALKNRFYQARKRVVQLLEKCARKHHNQKHKSAWSSCDELACLSARILAGFYVV